MNPFEAGANRPLFLPHKYLLEHAPVLRIHHYALDHNALDLNLSVEGAERVAAMGFNWVVIPFDDGLPPELLEASIERFDAGVRYYQQQDVQVIGVISVSTALATGSFEGESWYAVDPDDNRLLHSPQRYFVQLHHHDWQTLIGERIRQLATTGVDAIGLYVEGQGGFGLDLPTAPIGVIGTYDAASQQDFQAGSGYARLPQILNSGRQNVQQYIQWRAERLVASVNVWVTLIREHLPEGRTFLQVDDPRANNLLLNRGIAMRKLHESFDGLLIYDRNWFTATSLNQSDDGLTERHTAQMLVNALMVKKSVARHPNMLPVVPGSAPPHPVRHYSQLLLESLLLGVPIVMPGVAIRRRGQLSSLLHGRYAGIQQAVQQLNLWQSEWQAQLKSRQNAAPIAVLITFTEDALQWQPQQSLVSNILTVLQDAGYPLRVVDFDDDWDGVTVLVVPSGEMLQHRAARIEEFKATGGKLVLVNKSSDTVSERPVWRLISARTIRGVPLPLRPVLRLFNRQLMRLVNWYHTRRLFRRVVRWGLNRQFIARRLAVRQVLTDEMRHTLLQVIPSGLPRVESAGRMLFMLWREQDGTLQYNLLNYEAEIQSVTLHTQDLQAATVHMPGTPQAPQPIVGSSFMLSVDVSKIIRVQNTDMES